MNVLLLSLRHKHGRQAPPPRSALVDLETVAASLEDSAITAGYLTTKPTRLSGLLHIFLDDIWSNLSSTPWLEEVKSHCAILREPLMPLVLAKVSTQRANVSCVTV